MVFRKSVLKFYESMDQENANVSRRSANYKPSSWDFDAIQSLASNFLGDQECTERIEELRVEIGQLLRRSDVEYLNQLELIDALERLGLGYHFGEEINSFLGDHDNKEVILEDDLYATALHFKLLRLHGANVSQDIFKKFMEENGEYYKGELCEDVNGLLSLYEASQLGFHGEIILDKAKVFCAHNLEHILVKNSPQLVGSLKEELEHAIKNPFHRRNPWSEIRAYIGRYERRRDMEPCFLKMAQLNFNMEQAKHQQELKSISRWWKRIGLGDRLEFARDRCVEAYFLSLATIPEVQHGQSRKKLAKLFLLISTIDDVYDIYGTIDELQLFTDVVDRWDIDSSGQLPEYMKICFLALLNTINKFSYTTLKDQGLNITSYLSKRWRELCKTFMTEAKWLDRKHTPSLQEYMNNGWVSSSAPLILVHAFCFMAQTITKEEMRYLEEDPEPIFLASIIFRLCNDLKTSKDEAKRGDAPGSVQCYMSETGLSEENAEKYMKGLVSEAWRKMLKESYTSPSPSSKSLGNLAMSFARTVQATYQWGDGYGSPDMEMKRQILLVLLQPYPMSHN